MKKILAAAFLSLFVSAGFAQNKNITLKSKMKFPSGVRLSNICGFAKNGKEYALVGTSAGMTIVDVTNPVTPVKLFDIPGRPSIWREIKTWKDYAYVTTEGGGGLQIVDLTNLPGSAPYKNIMPVIGVDSLRTTHALHIDAGFLYLYGHNVRNRGALFFDLSDPWNPVYAGMFDQSPFSDWYIHDGYVRDNIMWACHVYAGTFSAIDVSDKSNPVVLSTQESPLKVTHNSWLSDNSKVLFITDETDSSYVVSYDVTNLNNIRELDRIRPANNKGSIGHNTHILNDYAVTSWYTDGVIIIDGHRPDNLVIVGRYDTSPLSGAGFKGCWGVYPFLPSGNLVASDIDDGLYVLAPDYKRACYLEGVVSDSLSSQPVTGALVEVASSGIKEYTVLTGEYKTGIADSGLYSIKYSKPGYRTRVTRNVPLKNGVLTIQNVKLIPGTGIDTVDANVQLVTSIAEPASVAARLNAYPNPFSGDITLRFSQAAPGSRIILRDMLGRMVLSQELNTQEGELRAGADLIPGIYFATLVSSQGTSSVMKLIKQ
jgi:choice-of-anchor B domain-containing protein